MRFRSGAVAVWTLERKALEWRTFPARPHWRRLSTHTTLVSGSASTPNRAASARMVSCQKRSSLRWPPSTGVAASTLAAAALFNPLRRRVQRIVDRRFNRACYDADELVSCFATRLRDAVDVETVLDELAAAAGRSLEPTHVTVWVRVAS